MRDWDSKGQTPNDENDDDLNWDWLSDAEQKETDSSDRTGLTGNLDWQGDKPSSSDQSSDEPKFDWQGDKPSGPRSSDTGLTGNLDWQGDKPSGPRSSDTGLTGNLDWQSGLPEPSEPETPSADEAWAEELSEDAENSESDTLYRPPEGLEAIRRANQPPPPVDTGELLDWMSDPEGQFGTPETEEDDAPDWMLELDDAPPAPRPNVVPVELPSWLDDLEPAEDPTLNTDEDEAKYYNAMRTTPLEQDSEEWTGESERTPTGFTGYLEESWADEEQPDAAWVNEDAETFEEPSFEDIAPVANEEFDFDSEFGLQDETPGPIAAFSDTDDSADEFDFDSMLGAEEEASGDPEFDALFNAVNIEDDPDAAIEDPIFENEEFDFNSILGEEEGDPVFDNLDLVPLFTSDEDDEPSFTPPVQAQKPPPADLDLDAMFGDAEAAGEEDWLTGFEAPEEEPSEQIDFDNFFGETEEPDPEADYIANIVASSRTDEANDWFAEPVGVDPDADPDWLDSLEDISLDDVMETPAAAPARPAPSSRQPEVDLDALFGDSDDAQIVPSPAQMEFFDINDFPELPDEEIPSFATENNVDVPDWLREAAASTDDQLSAAGIIRKKFQDRPLESLDDRLRALRDAGLSVASTAAEQPEQRRVLENVLPGIEETLSPGAKVVGSAATLDAALRVSPEHQKNAVLLRSLIGHSSAAEMKQKSAAARSRSSIPFGRWLVAAILLIAVAIPFFVPIAGIGDSPADAFAAGSAASNAFVRIGTLPRGAPVLVAAEYGPTGAAELDPMLKVTLTHILSQGALPILVSTNPVGFRHAENILIDLAGEANAGRAYYSLGYQPGTLLGLRNLDANSSVLFANRGLALSGLEDVALVLIVAENADSVQMWIEQTRIGDVVPVVIASSASAQPLIVPYTQQGQVAGLLTGYRDAVTYSRMLASQGTQRVILPDLPTPVILPTALPVTPTDIPPTPVPVIATEEATVEATQAVLVETEETDITPTLDEPTETEISITATQAEPTATDRPSATPTPEEPTATPTNEPGIRITPPDAENLVEVAIVIAPNTVNTRSGPGTTFDIVRTLAPGAQVRVLGYNDDNTWVNVVLPDGTEAWISEGLVAVRELPASEAGPITPQPPRRGQSPRGRRIAQIPTIDPSILETQSSVLTQSPGLELTGAAALTQVQIPGLEETQAAVLTQASSPGLQETQAAVLTQASVPGFEETQAAVLTQASVPGQITPGAQLTPAAPGDASSLTLEPPVFANVEERWNATTFGLGAAIVIIVIGNLVAGLRALLRRNQ